MRGREGWTGLMWGIRVAGMTLGLAMPLCAQAPEPWPVAHEVFAGSEVEEYIRTMQAAGEVGPYPWSVRAFSAGEVAGMVADSAQHPWDKRFDFEGDAGGSPRVGWIRPRAALFYNSRFPYGANDGAVWAGRGLTSAVRVGGWGRIGPLSVVVAPEAFRAENQAFPLEATGRPGRLVYADGRSRGIDLPQRFGSGAYMRLSPGQSTLRLDAGPFEAGISTANQFWGPASTHPLLLGNNAEGFPHLFLGSSHPLNLWIVRAHGRLVYGRLDQSEFSPVADPDGVRFMSGLVGTLEVRGVPGLEIGGGRFFHSPWPGGAIAFRHFAKPLEGFLKTSFRDGNGNVVSDDDNQLASIFFRWLVPRAGFEIYGEFGREDHSLNVRDLLLEPDHNSAYSLGARRVWARDSDRWTVLWGELVNAEISHLYRVRDQARFYEHIRMRQGHTQLGQALGSAAAFGGAGTELALDHYYPGGRWTVGWSRAVRDRRGQYWQRGIIERDAADTSHALRLEMLRFQGPLEIAASLTGVYELNRYFDGDAFNANAAMTLTWSP